jgi:hypothetical protein
LINAAFTNFFLSSSRFPHLLTKLILSRGVEGKEKGAPCVKAAENSGCAKTSANIEKTRVAGTRDVISLGLTPPTRR